MLSAAFLAPWLLLYWPYYFIAFSQPIHAVSPTAASVGERLDPLGDVSEMRQWHDLLLLFSPANTFYGAPILAYTCLAAGLILCAFFVVWRHRGDLTNVRSRTELGSAAAAAAAAYLFWVIVGPRLQELTNTLRYSIPVLIAGTSAALPLWVAVTARRNVAVYTTIAVLLLLLFASSTRQRVGTLLHQGSQLAYLHHWERWRLNRNREFERRALDGELTSEVRSLQEEIPPGQTLLAWTATPFLFDFSRNKVFDVNIAGLGQPWGRIPPVRYIIWKRSGYGAYREDVLRYEIARFGRRTAQLDMRALEVLRWLQQVDPMSNSSKMISDRDGVIVMQLDRWALPPPD